MLEQGYARILALAMLLGLLRAYRHYFGAEFFQQNSMTSPTEMENVVEFALVADRDIASRDPKEFAWHSTLQRGILRYDEATGLFDIHLTITEQLTSHMATRNRSMELSELIWWNNKYLTVCDYTGMVYKVRLKGEVAVFPRFVLADGNGKNLKTFKSEWMSRYYSQLYIGSHGKEWLIDGVAQNSDAEFVKIIEPEGAIRSIDWGDLYQRLRLTVGAEYPGYLTHEAVLWIHAIKKWIFLPRKASFAKDGIGYDTIRDEKQGSNILLIVSEDLVTIEAHTLGPLEPEWGVSSVRLVPGSSTMLMVAKVKEYIDPDTGKEVIATKLSLFDVLSRQCLLAPKGSSGEGSSLIRSDGTDVYWLQVSESLKYEGLEFVGHYENW